MLYKSTNDSPELAVHVQTKFSSARSKGKKVKGKKNKNLRCKAENGQPSRSFHMYNQLLAIYISNVEHFC